MHLCINTIPDGQAIKYGFYTSNNISLCRKNVQIYSFLTFSEKRKKKMHGDGKMADLWAFSWDW
jgi:hypothetical protein